jgi:2-polyprenyl-3-methyl-5-hydroxy-6-metoxy-1,4-benzoquinol methylase
MGSDTALEAWEANAEFWDTGMGATGNDYYNYVELPALRRMIDVKQGDRALDLATGNGLVAHWLAKAGAKVIATDGSKAMLERAEARGQELQVTADSAEIVVEYRLLDVTDASMWEKFIASEGNSFDIVVINMAIMDIPTLEPLAGALPRLLKKNGGR